MNKNEFSNSKFLLCIFRYETTIPCHEILQQEVSEICQVLSSAQSPLVLCHNDALCANFIYDEIKGIQISF